MAKLRSPNYPQLTLLEAIERVRRIYNAEHTNPTPKDVAVQDMGFSGMNGASAVVIGSLNRYGLLESTNEGLRVSDMAVAILELDEDDVNRQAAIREAALSPSLFSELHAQFENHLPSEGSLRHSLVKKGFLPKAAEEVIKVYRSNMSLIVEEVAEYNEGMESPSQALVPSPSHAAKLASLGGAHSGFGPSFLLPPDPKPITVTSPEESRSELRFKISADSNARILFSGVVTQEAIEKLTALLKLSQDTFPSAAEVRDEIEMERGQE